MGESWRILKVLPPVLARYLSSSRPEHHLTAFQAPSISDIVNWKDIFRTAMGHKGVRNHRASQRPVSPRNVFGLSPALKGVPVS